MRLDASGREQPIELLLPVELMHTDRVLDRIPGTAHARLAVNQDDPADRKIQLRREPTVEAQLLRAIERATLGRAQVNEWVVHRPFDFVGDLPREQDPRNMGLHEFNRLNWMRIGARTQQCGQMSRKSVLRARNRVGGAERCQSKRHVSLAFCDLTRTFPKTE